MLQVGPCRPQNAAARDTCNRGRVAHITQRHARETCNESESENLCDLSDISPSMGSRCNITIAQCRLALLDVVVVVEVAGRLNNRASIGACCPKNEAAACSLQSGPCRPHRANAQAESAMKAKAKPLRHITLNGKSPQHIARNGKSLSHVACR